MKNENFETCKGIALELEKICSGNYRICPNCGERHEIPDAIDNEEYTCPHCGESADGSDWEYYSIYNHLTDVYDVEFSIGSDKQYRSVRIMVACGGPNIYINTRSGDVELFWWTESARYTMSRDVIEMVDQWAEEWYLC